MNEKDLKHLEACLRRARCAAAAVVLSAQNSGNKLLAKWCRIQYDKLLSAERFAGAYVDGVFIMEDPQ